MLLNSLLFCLVFLGLFAQSLWPLLLRESKHWKTLLIVINVFYLMLAVYAVNYAAKTKKDLTAAQRLFHSGLQSAACQIVDRPEAVLAAGNELQNIGLDSSGHVADPLAQTQAFQNIMSKLDSQNNAAATGDKADSSDDLARSLQTDSTQEL